jgi:hypothetical protein
MSDIGKEWREVLRQYIEQQEVGYRMPIEFNKPRTLSESEEILKLMRSHNLTNQSEQDYDK